MRNLLKYFSVFIILTVLISGFAACGNKSDTNAVSTANDKMPPLSNTTTGTADAPKPADSSEFPLAPATLAQSEIKMVSGTNFKLEDQKGKVILFNLWATWCGPCVGEMPDLVALQEKYKDKNFKIIGLDADNEPNDKIIEFGAKQKLNYELGAIDEDQMNDFLKVSKRGDIPQSILVDRQGRLRGVWVGAGPKNLAQLKESVEKAVSE